MATVMTAWDYTVWGPFGGFAINGLEFAGAIRSVGGWPWHRLGGPGPLPLAVPVQLAAAPTIAAIVPAPPINGLMAASTPEPAVPAQTEPAQGGDA
jgi:hypothetical protein